MKIGWNTGPTVRRSSNGITMKLGWNTGPTVRICNKHQGSFGVVNFCSLRGKGRKGWEDRLKNGMKMKHMISADVIEFSLC